MIEKFRPLFNMRSRLTDIPADWLRLVEPRIYRPQGTSCWLWDGGVDGKGEPVIHVASAKGKRTMRRVKRIVAAMFWHFKPHNDIVHRCGTVNCLNPNHFYVSASHWTQEDRKAMIREGAAMRRMDPPDDF